VADAVLAVEALAERLEARHAEIEHAVLTRVFALEDRSEVADSEYALGLKAAVCAGLAYGLSALTAGSGKLESTPPELLAQARRAARLGVGLDTVLRRYIAGHALLDDFIAEEADALGVGGRVVGKSALRAEAVLLDRLIAVVAAEYKDEVEALSWSWRDRRAECVRRLLAGELADAGELHYDLGGWHVAAVARGIEVDATLRGLAKDLDLRVLLVPDADGGAMAWLGGARRPDPHRLHRLATAKRHAGAAFSFGDPGRGIEGWRFTHRQATAGLPIALRETSGVVSYGDVALLAAALRDDVLAESLRQAYLVPLEGGGDGGWALRETLRAYMAADGNVSSTAAVLGVSRQTVKKRISIAQEKIGQPVSARGAEIKTALHLARWLSSTLNL
jgi:hypothetical protein